MKRNFIILAALLSLGLAGCGGQFQFEETSIGSLEKSTGDEDANQTEIQCDPETETCVLLCHVPPGNPAARHAILVGEPAVEAHLTNHDRGEVSQDYLGPCLDDETQEQLNPPEAVVETF